MRTLAFVSVIVACSSGPKPAPDQPAPPTSSMLDCDKVADHVATIAAARPRPGITQGQIKEMVGSHCKADAWTDDTKQCLNAMTTIKDGRACADNMTEEQRTAIKTAARALRKDGSEPVADDNSSDWIRHVVQDQPD